jgi:type IV pilus assembly protein PilQ
MKKILRALIFGIFSLNLSFVNVAAEPRLAFSDLEPEISMDFQDANLKDVIKVFSIQSGLNFIASEAVQDRKITLYMDKVPLNQAMDKLFKANNLSYELDKESNIFIVKDWGKLVIETVTKVFRLRYATVSSSSLEREKTSIITPVPTTGGISTGTAGWATTGTQGTGTGATIEESGITKAVKKLLTPVVGSIIEDFRTNSLIVTDTPMRLSVISQVIASLDVPAPQVMLEVEMLDVSKDTIDKLGIKFGSTPLTMVLTGAKRGTLWPFRDTSLPMASESKMTPGSMDFSTATYTVLLDFLKTQTDTRFLARPRILTLNNETAEIKIATQESIGVTTTTEATTGTTSATPERTETGVVLRVTPQINQETGEITMLVYPKVGEAVQGSAFTSDGKSFQFRDPEERSTKTIVRIKDGDTIIIGGLIRSEFNETLTKLPILGDIPVVGSLFRHRSKSKDKERELLVFITPHIIKDKEFKLAQINQPVIPMREQNSALGVSRDLEISSSLNNFDKNKK